MPSAPTLACLAVLLALAACGSRHLQTANHYLAQGNTAVAVELLDAGLVKDPGNTEVRDALVVAQQVYQHELRRDVDRLKENGLFLAALSRLVSLEAAARRAAEIPLPTEDPAAVEQERLALTRQAVAALSRSFDERLNRTVARAADVLACQQLIALVEDDPALSRLCAGLHGRLKLATILEPEPGADAMAARLLGAMAAEADRRHARFFEVVSAGAGTHNARLRLFVGAPRASDTGVVLVQRDAFHAFVPKLDRKGRPVEESVTVAPTAEQIADAEKRGAPPPAPKTVKKKVYEPVQGEVRRYRARRTLAVPYRVVLESLAHDTVAVALGGEKVVSDESHHFEYTGDPRGRDGRLPSMPEGRANARPLATTQQLVARITGELPAELVAAVLERLE